MLERARDVQRCAKTAKVLELHRYTRTTDEEHGKSPCTLFRPMKVTYESAFLGIRERFRGEPFPHESARGSIVRRCEQAADVIVHWKRGTASAERQEYAASDTDLGSGAGLSATLAQGPSRMPSCGSHCHTSRCRASCPSDQRRFAVRNRSP